MMKNMLTKYLALFLLLFGVNPVFAGVKVKEKSEISINQDYLNSQLRNLLREDIQFGVINVYDGSNWVSGPTSIHFDEVNLVILEGGVQMALKASINSPLGRKTQKISRTLSVSELKLEIDANGICNMISNLSESVLAASDVLTDMYPGSRIAPIGLLKNQLKRLVMLPKFAAYLKGVAVEKCYPASFTGVVDFALVTMPGKVNITVAPEIEYLDIEIGILGNLIDFNTASLQVFSNFPVAVKNASGVSITGAFKDFTIKSDLTSYNPGYSHPWVSIIRTSWGLGWTAYSPDYVIDVESPCGEFVQHFQASLYDREFRFVPNGTVGVP